jgi:SurA N-terminal domain
MQENNQKEGTETTTPPEVVTPTPAPVVDPVQAPAPTIEDQTTVVSDLTEVQPVVTSTKSPFTALKRYGWALVAIIIIGAGLLFVLEREGRVSTGIFSAFEHNRAVARVNGVKIIKGDYDSSVKQLLQMAAAQGANTTDPAVAEQLKTQAMETLVNGELLRQAAQAANIIASAEAVNTRYDEVTASVGGADVLATRMAEFEITEKSLRRDIENEILIKELIATVIDPNASPVTDEEIATVYEQAKQGLKDGAKLPPLAEVKTTIAEQIAQDRQNAKISEFLESKRSEASIEMVE